jgi:hypothetical protein
VGYDVVAQPHEVRRRIGLTGQYAALDHASRVQRPPRDHPCAAVMRSTTASKAATFASDIV